MIQHDDCRVELLVGNPELCEADHLIWSVKSGRGNVAVTALTMFGESFNTKCILL